MSTFKNIDQKKMFILAAGVAVVGIFMQSTHSAVAFNFMIVLALLVILAGMIMFAGRNKHMGAEENKGKEKTIETQAWQTIPDLSQVGEPCLDFESLMIQQFSRSSKPWSAQQIEEVLIKNFRPWRGFENESVSSRAIFVLLVAAKYRDISIDYDYNYLCSRFREIYRSNTGAINQEKEVQAVIMQFIHSLETIGWDWDILANEISLYSKKHFYSQTLFMGLLEDAKDKGVLSTAEFSWLKGVDRTLYLCLNAVGRYTFLPEIAGIAAHWQWEKECSMGCEKIEVGSAVAGLIGSMNDEYPRFKLKSQASNGVKDITLHPKFDTTNDKTMVKEESASLRGLQTRVQRLEEEIELLKGRRNERLS